MRYIVLGALVGMAAGYTVEAFFPFKPLLGGYCNRELCRHWRHRSVP